MPRHPAPFAWTAFSAACQCWKPWLFSRYGRVGAAAVIGLLAALLVNIGVASGRLWRGGTREAPETSRVVRSPAFARALRGTSPRAWLLFSRQAWRGRRSGSQPKAYSRAATSFWVRVVGGLIGQLWKFAATGRALTAAEAFWDVLVTGLLAASSSSQAVWQAPAAWADLLTLSGTGEMTFLLVYHLANAYTLTTAKSI